MGVTTDRCIRSLTSEAPHAAKKAKRATTKASTSNTHQTSGPIPSNTPGLKQGKLVFEKISREEYNKQLHEEHLKFTEVSKVFKHQAELEKNEKEKKKLDANAARQRRWYDKHKKQHEVLEVHGTDSESETEQGTQVKKLKGRPKAAWTLVSSANTC